MIEITLNTDLFIHLLFAFYMCTGLVSITLGILGTEKKILKNHGFGEILVGITLLSIGIISIIL